MKVNTISRDRNSKNFYIIRDKHDTNVVVQVLHWVLTAKYWRSKSRLALTSTSSSQVSWMVMRHDERREEGLITFHSERDVFFLQCSCIWSFYQVGYDNKAMLACVKMHTQDAYLNFYLHFFIITSTAPVITFCSKFYMISSWVYMRDNRGRGLMRRWKNARVVSIAWEPAQDILTSVLV